MRIDCLPARTGVWALAASNVRRTGVWRYLSLDIVPLPPSFQRLFIDLFTKTKILIKEKNCIYAT